MKDVDRRYAGPVYTPIEFAADGLVHVLGNCAALAGIIWLALSLGPAPSARQIVALLLYSFGLFGMLAASAAYNLCRPGSAKALLRQVDHAMIFVMIAGSYTPLALNGLAGAVGRQLFASVWTLAAIGIVLQLAWPRWAARVSIALYLGLGWLLLAYIRSLSAALSGRVLLLLLAGGVVYSAGSLVHAWRRLPFHNAIWHAMVLVAAGLHLAAMRQLLGPS